MHIPARSPNQPQSVASHYQAVFCFFINRLNGQFSGTTKRGQRQKVKVHLKKFKNMKSPCLSDCERAASAPSSQPRP